MLYSFLPGVICLQGKENIIPFHELPPTPMGMGPQAEELNVAQKPLVIV